MFAASKTDGASDGGYQISRSLRFNSADTAYLTRTPASASNRKTWTWSAWVKRGTMDRASRYMLFGSRPTANPYTLFYFSGSSQPNQYGLRFEDPSADLQTTQVFRDPSAWYHIVLAVDTTQATASNRIKMYVNGVQITAFSTATYPTQNTDMAINNNTEQCIGNNTYDASTEAFNGYMTEINFIDGTQLTPSSFGETNAQTGVWQPKAYSGSYGTNGFYVNFSDNSNTTAATLGKDYSGNGNNWTPNNFSVTAGVGNDSFVDSPTSYGTDTGVGGEVRGNYATLNPLLVSTTFISILNGNLQQGTVSSATYQEIPITFAFNFSGSNKWYAEVNTTTVSGTYYPSIAISPTTKNFMPQDTQGGATSGSTAYMANGQKYNNGSLTSYGSAFTSGDVVGIAVDEAAGTVVMYKNNVSQGTLVSSLTGLQYLTVTAHTGSNFYFNAGQRPFAYTAPSGFKALCTQNLPTPTIGATTATQAGKYFNPVLYTGNGTTQSITGVGFQPDWTWIKSRNNGSTNNALYDAVRGAGKVLFSNTTEGENTVGDFTSFNSDGFSVSTVSGTRVETNASGYTYVGWNWKANGSGSTNTAGQITSTVSASTTSGFSIVTFTTDGTTKTVGHGLGVKPSLVIVKVRNGAGSWIVMTDIINGSMQYGALQSTAAFASIGYSAPTSTVFQYNDNNGNTQVAYCFAPIAGYSAFGTYTGNGNTNRNFVYLGFTPALILVKRTSSSGTNWRMVRPRSVYLSANTSDAEYASYPGPFLQTANGFEISGGDDVNENGGTFIYAAFASVPFKFSLAQ